MTHGLAIAFLMIGTATALWCTWGFLRAPNAFARLHYLTPVSTIATFAVAVAVVIDGPDYGAAIKAVIVFVVTAVTSPVTQANIAHALWTRREGEER